MNGWFQLSRKWLPDNNNSRIYLNSFKYIEKNVIILILYRLRDPKGKIELKVSRRSLDVFSILNG